MKENSQIKESSYETDKSATESKVKYVRMKTKNDTLDFEDTTHQLRKRDNKQDSDSIPAFLAITFIDQNFGFKKLLTEGVEMLFEEFGADNANLKSTCESLLRLTKTDKMQKDGWKFPTDFHLTCLYLNRDEDKAESSQIFQRFKEGVRINIDIQAFVIVPDKIVTAICFPDQNVQPVENLCPHVTLAVNEWQAY